MDSSENGWLARAQIVTQSQWALRVLVAMLVVDLAFLVAHILHLNQAPFFWRIQFRMDSDFSFPEFFQYAKQLACAGAFGYVALRMRSLLVASISAVCLLFFLEDAFLLHEVIGGEWLAGTFSENPDVDSRRYGQLWYGLAVGSVALAIVGVVWLRSNEQARAVALPAILIIGGIGFFGVIFDAVPERLVSAAWFGKTTNAIEEMGEHVFTSALVWWSLVCLSRTRTESSG
jgi:hypothetical protein